MEGEFLSLETAEKLKEYEDLEKRYNKLSELYRNLVKRKIGLDNRIIQALEILSKINYEDKNEYISPLEILPVYKILLGSDKE